jgi:cytochrome c553
MTMLRLRRTSQFVSLVLLVSLGETLSPAAQTMRSSGREIYQRQCVRCHGPKGEGVPGKYDGPLHGSRPLEKLTGYIERNMPEDDPGTCKGQDAAAVARYIYDAFYSRDAQSKKNPARVELVRLTNRQYLNTVADLLKHFTGSDNAVTAERGLRAAYYSSRNFNGNKKVIDRTDRQIDFDFGEGNPDAEHFPTNEFAIQWRGSLIADETGEYEFILKTPNGVRLWVNHENEPVIDAWVSSGQLAEHKTTLRLIGGRVYPLRVDCFKFKDKTASISLQWKPPHDAQQLIPTRNLSPARVSSTFAVSVPFPPDDSSVGYERGVSVSKAWDEATTQAAIEVANHVVSRLDDLTRSKPTDTNRLAQAEAFCTEFVATAFRRPLTAEQKRLHITDQFKRAKKAEDAVKRAVLLALKSPRFLYLGLDGAKPDDYEIASRLAFGLWDSLPDRELAKLAAKGELHTREQITAQAQRMLRDPRAKSKSLGFLHHWLQVDRVESLSKDHQLFPGFTPEIITDLRASLDVFLEDAFWNGDADFRKLLTADYLYVNQRLAQFYGLDASASDEFVKVKIADGQRSGVLTHPYLLAAFSYPKQTSPIHRGVFLTRNIVGRALKPPPVAVAFKDAEFAPNLTMREKVSELTRPGNCQSCHSVINPLGFSLEHFDAVGRFRTSEQDRPIDAASDFVTDDGATIRLTGPRDIARFALESEPAQNAFIEQFFYQVVKQPALAYGSDTMSRLRQSFVTSGFNLQKLLVEIAVTSAAHRLEPTGRAR